MSIAFRFGWLALIGGLLQCSSPPQTNEELMIQGLQNGLRAQEGFWRCDRYMKDWLAYADSQTGLIPRNLYESKNIWNIQDAAADNYPFMVLTSFFTDTLLYEGSIRDILATERQLTNRLGNLPDAYSFSREAFHLPELDTGLIIFGASEYVKDGLLPLTEYLGSTPWSQRMLEILDDIGLYASIATDYGNIPSRSVEINGEMLQVLARVFSMTQEPKYLEWGIRLGDYYLLGDQHPTRNMEQLRLRDHGCEIISGLCELYVVLSFIEHPKKAQYEPHIHEMLDRILEVGTNEDGMFYNVINPQTGAILDEALADTWGYTYNGYYAVYMIDEVATYRKAVEHVLNRLDSYRGYDWENQSADGYADAIEGALNLYNRLPSEQVAEWIDSQMTILWSMQDSSQHERGVDWHNKGIIEGWHGDGNFARTTLMYNLWKTQGTYAKPWQKELVLGALTQAQTLHLFLQTEIPWKGRVYVDEPRHQAYFNLALDYPRINQFPEWWTVNDDELYKVTDSQLQPIPNLSTRLSGKQLTKEGIPLQLEPGIAYHLMISPAD